LNLKSKKEENFVQPKPFKEISPKNNDCVRSGCNGEICQEKGKKPIYSICLYHPKYECY
jgi:eight-cysteine-cluster-containing protein